MVGVSDKKSDIWNQGRIKGELANQNEGMVPARYYVAGQDEALDNLRRLFRDFYAGVLDEFDFCEAANEVVVGFENGRVKPGRLD